MTNKTLPLTPALYQYICDVALCEHPVQQALRIATAQLTDVAQMQIAPEQGQFMQLLVRLLGARQILEIGTFTGYSALCMALGLPEHGQIQTCDINTDWTDIAKHYWTQAGIAQKIILNIAPALETLTQFKLENKVFDLVFIDADKANTLNYYQQALALTRPGGLILIDNVLWGGRVADSDDTQNSTQCLREVNQFVCTDVRVFTSLVPIADGLLLALKK